MSTVIPLARNLGLLAASVLMALLAAEGAVRVFQPQDMLRNFSWYVSHPAYRMRHRSDMDRMASWEQEYHIRTNSRGLREDREIDFDGAKQWRALVFGDSFTFGNGVEGNETYVRKSESVLNAGRAQATVQLVNFGVSAHGPGLEYLYYLEEGRKYRHDAVIVGVFLGNDVADDQRDGAYVLEGDDLVFRPAEIGWKKRLTENPVYQWLVDRSHLLIFVRNRVAALVNRERNQDQEQLIRGAMQGSAEVSSHEGNHVPIGTGSALEQSGNVAWEGEQFQLTRRIYAEFLRTVRGRSATFLLLLLPTREQIERVAGEADVPDVFALADPTREMLLEFCSETSATCLDLLPIFAQEVTTDIRATDYFIPGDFHYNARGHAVVAQALALELSEFIAPLEVER